MVLSRRKVGSIPPHCGSGSSSDRECMSLRYNACSATTGVCSGLPARCRPKSLRSVACSVLFFSASLVCGAAACGVVKEKSPDKPDEMSIVGKDIPPEKAKEVLHEVGGNFAYGPGLGDTAVNVGTVVVFPPYAIYLLGNAVLSLSGYEPVTVASMLPEEHGKQWSSTYDQIVSGPGKMVAAMAGHEYRSREVADQRLKRVLDDINKHNESSGAVEQGKGDD